MFNRRFEQGSLHWFIFVWFFGSALMVMPDTFRQIKKEQYLIQAELFPVLFYQLQFIWYGQSEISSQFFKKAISTSFLPNSISSCCIFFSSWRTLVSVANSSGPCSSTYFFQALTEVGWALWRLATWADSWPDINST